jgi:hypothetical protein
LIFFSVVRKKQPDYATALVRCQKQGEISKKQCWEKEVRNFIKTYGIDDSLELLSRIYSTDSQFAGTCHAMTHIIGQTAYFQFRSKGSIPLSDKTAYCSFGFYHGFMETLIARKGTVDEARKFCDKLETTLAKRVPDIRYGCYHGIGHGATDVHNPKYFGNERALIKPALTICESFARNEEQLRMCATGIFDSISIAYYNKGDNGLVMKKDDPLWLCHEQPDKYKTSCYLDMMPAISWMGDQDLNKSLPIAVTHVEAAYKVTAVRSLAEDSVRFIIHTKPTTDYLPTCRTLSDTPVYTACIQGLSAGVMQFGKPAEEYKEALAFCAMPQLTTDEKGICFRTVLSNSYARYAKEMADRICRSVPAEYQEPCRT